VLRPVVRVPAFAEEGNAAGRTATGSPLRAGVAAATFCGGCRLRRSDLAW
jgi:hypothetical protein